MPYTDELVLQRLERLESLLEQVVRALNARPQSATTTPPTAPSTRLTEMDEYIDDQRAAAITGLSRAWFQKKRVEGGGPPYTKIGRGSVRYRLSDLHAWMTLNRVKHSTESHERERR